MRLGMKFNPICRTTVNATTKFACKVFWKLEMFIGKIGRQWWTLESWWFLKNVFFFVKIGQNFGVWKLFSGLAKVASKILCDKNPSIIEFLLSKTLFKVGRFWKLWQTRKIHFSFRQPQKVKKYLYFQSSPDPREFKHFYAKKSLKNYPSSVGLLNSSTVVVTTQEEAKE